MKKLLYYSNILLFMVVCVLLANSLVLLKDHIKLLSDVKFMDSEKKCELIEKNLHGDRVKEFAIKDKKNLQKIVKMLISKYEHQNIFIQCPAFGITICNDKLINDDDIDDVIDHMRSSYAQKSNISIAYEYYIPSKIELIENVDLASNDTCHQIKYGTSEGRYRIDFYLYEGKYVRMGIKYLSVDDVIESEASRYILGEKLGDGWYYFMETVNTEIQPQLFEGIL